MAWPIRPEAVAHGEIDRPEKQTADIAARHN